MRGDWFLSMCSSTTKIAAYIPSCPLKRLNLIFSLENNNNQIPISNSNLNNKETCGLTEWKLKYLYVKKAHPAVEGDRCGYYFLNGAIFQGDKKNQHVLIRLAFERICKGCFYHANLVLVAIPSSVTEISFSAFDKCKLINKIKFVKNSRLNLM